MTRRYYQLLDFAQTSWSRFRVTEAGRATIWLAPRLLRWSWVALKLSMAFFAAFMLVSFGFMAFMVLIVTGNGKAATASFTKITLVVIGLFAASRLVVKKPQLAEAVKAIAKK